MRQTPPLKWMPLLLLLMISVPITAQEVEYNWTNAEGNNSWYDPGNWGIDDTTTPNSVNAVVGIGAGPGNVVFGAGSATSGATILNMNVGAGAGIEINSGFIGFAERTPGRQFSLQNSGAINVTGNTASLRLKDEAHNFSSAVINLHNGGAIDVNNGHSTLNTSNLNTGNGTINMSSDAGEPDSEITGSGGAIFTIEKQTISGNGNIGTNSLGLVFGSETIVDANVSGRTMIVDGDNSTGTVNQGLMKASGGGTLDIRDQLNNAGGLVESQAGSTVKVDGATITGGTLRNNGSFTNRNSTFENLTLEGDYSLSNAGNLGLAGTITNTGDISISNTNTATDLQIDDAAILTGGGTVTLGGVFSSSSRITDDNGGGVLTNVDNTIRGKGVVGDGKVRFTNEVGGTIDANDSTGSLTLGPVSGSAMVNRGLMKASNEGTLVFGSGEYDNAGGTIDLQDDSTITLNSGSNITGGTLQNLGTGSFSITGTGSLTDLTTNGSLNVENSDNLKLTGTINNLGDISVTNTNTATDIQIDTDATLVGGGTVTLGGVFESSSRITDDNGGGVLTNVDNTIRGKGLVGDGQIQIINEAGGTIDGNDSTGSLTLGGTSSATSINRGLLTASNGGDLTLIEGEFDNSSGLIEPQTGSSVTVGGTSVVTGGILNATDGSTINFSGSGKVVDATLQSGGTGKYEVLSGTGALENVINESSITVNNAANLELIGAIANSGDISAMNTNTATDLQIDGTVSLTGGGTVTLGGVFNNSSRITDDNSAGVLTNVDNTIRGKGLVGDGKVQITNEAGATIDANDSSGSLMIGAVSGSIVVNRGLLTATNEGNLVLGAGEYDNVGGTIDIQDDSTITLNSGSNITGGTVQNLGTGSFDMTSTGSFTDLTTKGTINVNNSDNLKLIGTIDNLGDISVINTNTATDIQIDTAATLTGGGTVTLGGVFSTSSRITDDNGDGVLTNVDNTIRGKGNVGDGKVQITNEVGGTIDANDSTGSLTLGPASGSAMVNRGLMRASNQGNLSFGSGEYDNVGGTIDIQDDSTITLNSGSNITGGTVQNLGTGIFSIVGTGSLTDLTINGLTNVDNSDNLKLTGTINNLGNISVMNTNTATDIQIDTAATLTGGGTVTLGGVFSTSSRITDDNGGGVLTNVDNTIRGMGLVGDGDVQIENLSQGVILADISGSSLIIDSSAAVFSNFGKLAAENNSVLDVLGSTLNEGTVDVQAGSVIEFDTLVNGTNGELVGTGIIDTTTEILNNGKISPGNSPGTLTFDADLELGNSSILEFELASFGLFDELIVNGDVELGGDLELVLLSGYTPDDMDIFDIMMTSSLSGAFANVIDGGRLMTVDGGGSFQVNYGGGTSVQLSSFSANAVPEPSAAAILMLAGVALFSRRRRG